MSFIKFISATLIFIMYFSLTGCSNKLQTPKTDMRLDTTITGDVTEYTPSISSAPGILITTNFETNIEEKNIKYHWITEQGTFLGWKQDNGNITILGKDIKINKNNIYWSVSPNEKISQSPFKVYLKIEDNNSSKVMYETSIQIDEIKDGVFSVKK